VAQGLEVLTDVLESHKWTMMVQYQGETVTCVNQSRDAANHIEGQCSQEFALSDDLTIVFSWLQEDCGLDALERAFILILVQSVRHSVLPSHWMAESRVHLVNG
jgi:hypothetical protein